MEIVYNTGPRVKSGDGVLPQFVEPDQHSRASGGDGISRQFANPDKPPRDGVQPHFKELYKPPRARGGKFVSTLQISHKKSLWKTSRANWSNLSIRQSTSVYVCVAHLSMCYLLIICYVLIMHYLLGVLPADVYLFSWYLLTCRQP